MVKDRTYNLKKQDPERKNINIVREADSRDSDDRYTVNCVNQASTFRTSHLPKKNIPILRIDLYLLQDAITNNHLTDLAFFYLLKSNFRSSIIYKFHSSCHSHRIAERLKISTKTALRRLNKCLELGLITEYDTFFALRKTSLRFGKIQISSDETVYTLKNKLQFLLIRKKAKSQAYLSSLRQYLSASPKVKDMYRTQQRDEFSPVLSCRYIARILKISIGQAHGLIRIWNMEGRIKTSPASPEFVCRMPKLALKYLSGFYDFRFNVDNKLFRIPPSKHTFLTDPIVAPFWNFKKFKKFYRKIENRPFINEINDYRP